MIVFGEDGPGSGSCPVRGVVLASISGSSTSDLTASGVVVAFGAEMVGIPSWWLFGPGALTRLAPAMRTVRRCRILALFDSLRRLRSGFRT